MSKRRLTDMDMNFYLPTRLITGRDCLAANKNTLAGFGKKCLIVTGRSSAVKCGALKDVRDALDAVGVKGVLFDRIGQNPKLSDCMLAAQMAVKEEVDFIVGIGGGSPLDAAKCIAVLAANPGMDQSGLYSLKWENKPMKVVAVGTTAGTGSEVTKVSVITNLQGRKKSFNHDDIYPAIAFGDPKYTLTLDEQYTVSTAIDALAHCVESYFNRNANVISQGFAVSGVRILMDEFKKMLADPGKELSFEQRENLYNASIYGGLAINKTGTCLPHAMGYLLTEEFGLPHGFACAVYLKAFYEINKAEVPELCSSFFEETGISESEYLEIIEQLLKDIRVTMTEDDIVNAHERWIGNGSIAKGWGNVSAEDADDILKRLFM